MGWVYLIRNEDLHKIGITNDLARRMRELKPTEVIKTVRVKNPRKLEKKLHQKYSSVRISQTEYFRLNRSQVESARSKWKIRKASVDPHGSRRSTLNRNRSIQNPSVVDLRLQLILGTQNRATQNLRAAHTAQEVMDGTLKEPTQKRAKSQFTT